METNTAVSALSALAQETRLQIFKELVAAHSMTEEEGGLAVGELIKRLDVAPPTLSFHLKELTNARLISPRKKGRSIIYRANLAEMQSLVTFLLQDCCSGACGVTLPVTATDS
ncbi:MAG: winged helix-turn-helix transcriptional regulator [Gammaproteobacteria bacterium]|jgi:ArsR family transcriptional regulator, arsenate/arsenite/antimonite-responsive transcriptional repressor|nr:winged helix-turn-helix transcriptional regulator [Gammaproteobacteria bacterium]MBT4492651.1 winged helix-turn-helix transcriptional regulator [Gammaproteobacteria bacterium]